MIGLLQRVTNASVTVDDELIGEIGRGLLVFVAVHRDDKEADIARLAERVLTYRVFPDAAGRMNRSLIDESLALLLVPQFTLAADTGRARGPVLHGPPRRKLAKPISDNLWQPASPGSRQLQPVDLGPICRST